MTEVAARLRARIARSHQSLGRELKQVLDESARPSCCVHDTVGLVKGFAPRTPGQPSPRDPKADRP